MSNRVAIIECIDKTARQVELDRTGIIIIINFVKYLLYFLIPMQCYIQSGKNYIYHVSCVLAQHDFVFQIITCLLRTKTID